MASRPSPLAGWLAVAFAALLSTGCAGARPVPAPAVPPTGPSSPAPARPPAPAPASDRGAEAAREGHDADRAMASAVAARDVEAFVGHLAKDTLFFGTRGPAAGPAGVALAWEPYFRPDGPRLAWAPDRALAAASGDVAFTFGHWTWTPAGGGQAATGRYMTAWRRDADGLLRVALDGGDDPLPALPEGVARRSLRTIVSSDGALLAEAGLLLEGPREAGWYLRLARRDGAGFATISEGGVFRPAER